MNVISVISRIFFCTLLLLQTGCESVPATAELPPQMDNTVGQPLLHTSYIPAKVDILPLTEFTYPDAVGGISGIKVYVSLLDEFDCQIKAPAVFRFELYDKVERSAEPKGKRIAIWPDIDLTQPATNNRYWRDFLRAYEFNLELEPKQNRNCILQVTSLCPTGKRLSSDFALKYTD